MSRILDKWFERSHLTIIDHHLLHVFAGFFGALVFFPYIFGWLGAIFGFDQFGVWGHVAVTAAIFIAEAWTIVNWLGQKPIVLDSIADFWQWNLHWCLVFAWWIVIPVWLIGYFILFWMEYLGEQK